MVGTGFAPAGLAVTLAAGAFVAALALTADDLGADLTGRPLACTLFFWAIRFVSLSRIQTRTSRSRWAYSVTSVGLTFGHRSARLAGSTYSCRRSSFLSSFEVAARRCHLGLNLGCHGIEMIAQGAWPYRPCMANRTSDPTGLAACNCLHVPCGFWWHPTGKLVTQISRKMKGRGE